MSEVKRSRDELRAEVGRLHAEIVRALDEPTQNEHDLYAEVERLQGQIRELGALGSREVLAHEHTRAEVERLQTECRELSGECDQWQRKLTEVWAEREQLRAVVDIAREYAKSGTDTRLSSALAALDRVAE